MASYFSQLIQQTGLSVSSAKRNSQSKPISLEHSFPAIEQKPLRDFEQMASEPLRNHQAEVTDVVNLAPVTLDRSSPPPTPLSETALHHSQSTVKREPSPTGESVVKVLEIEKSSDQNLPLPPANPRTDKHGAIQPLPERPTEPTSQASITPSDRPIALQAVRAWVAQPTENPANPQTPNMEEPKPLTTPISAQVSPLSPHFQEANQPTQFRPPETQNFILSIGTIQLTIEQPQPVIPQHQPSAPKTERVTPPSNLNSRLSRHYIRPR